MFFPATCGDPTPVNGQLHPSLADGIYPENTTVSFTCDDGLTLSGNSSSTCDAQGTWNPQPPTCQGYFIFSI